MVSIRKPAVADAFYPGEPEELKGMISKFLKDAKNVKIDGKLRALVVPHAGYIYSGPVAAFGYKLLERHNDKFMKIIMIGPSHFATFPGAAESGADGWQTPLGIVKSGVLGEGKKSREIFRIIPEVHAPEHCLEVQIPFLQLVLKNDFTIFPLLTGEVDPAELAAALMRFVDEETLIIASSDLSHYNPYAVALKLDSICNNAIPALDINEMETSGDACGKTAILTLMNLAKKKKWKGKYLDYRNSGDTAGPKDSVVGYGCYAFFEV